MRKSFYPVEVASILNDFREYLAKKNIVAANKIEDENMDEFLRSKHIEIQKPEQSEGKFEGEEDTDPNNET